jgi:hypothetical protein
MLFRRSITIEKLSLIITTFSKIIGDFTINQALLGDNLHTINYENKLIKGAANMLTFKYDAPLSEYREIPAGTKVKYISESDVYEGFVVVEYEGKMYMFSQEYFVEVNTNKLNDKLITA